MPELPEVQTIVNGLQPIISHKKIANIIQYRKGTVHCFCKINEFGTVTSLARRGKYIIIKTSEAFKIIIHLGMTGKLIYKLQAVENSKHCRAEIIFSDQSRVFFDDVRTFGKIHIFRIDDTVIGFENMGVEPLSASFNFEYLLDKVKNRKAPIKNLLMNQGMVAGLGNIYASEILHRAHIDPRKISAKLSKKEVEKIIKHTKKVLQEAILHNGTSVSDFRHIEDKKGEFQNFLKVYQKEVCHCGSVIKRVKMAGRSTYFCPQCQK